MVNNIFVQKAIEFYRNSTIVISNLELVDVVALDYISADKLSVIKDSKSQVILGDLEEPEYIRDIMVVSLSSNQHHP